MSYQVYILQSLVDSSFYIGYTKDLNHRLIQHNRAKTGYSSKKLPWKIVYTESFNEKSQAIKREKFLKKQKSHEFIERLVRS